MKKDSKRVSGWAAGCIIVVAVAAAVGLAFALAGNGGQTPEDTAPTGQEATRPTIPGMELADGAYERWLAASMVMAAPLEYPGMDVPEIFIASETELAHQSESKGAYLRFTWEGKTVALYSAPLDRERTEKGSRDLYSMLLGFSTFEEVDPKTLDETALIRVAPEELQELIEQSLLVSIYGH